MRPNEEERFNPAAKPAEMAARAQVRVRMYCQGLGDCFLLTFPRQGGQRAEFHVLIDCGVISGTQNARNLTHAVVQHIHETTQGHLDLVVATHEHWDHVSGFNQARDLFNSFKIDRIWLGWTEDPKDSWNIVKDRAAKLEALRQATERMSPQAALDKAVRTQQNSIREVLSFFGDSLALDAGEPGRRTTRDAVNYLSGRSGSEVTYCYPSKPPLGLDGVEDVRVYVFGPPENVDLLRMNDPTRAGKTYELAANSGEDSFYAALSPAGLDTRYSRIKDLTYPFEEMYRIQEERTREARDAKFFETYYNFEGKAANSWRRIDADWLDVTSELALNLDSDTNNTSLVLAFELGKPGSGKVLLFAADAQVGNWLSWKDLSWKLPGAQSSAAITAHQLLERTVLYKVGHHGSHNATLSELGLDLMNRDDLVAMIPVDQAKAEDKGWEEMPFGPLLEVLREKTKGRILRIDDPGKPARPELMRLSEAQWDEFVGKLGIAEAAIEGETGLKKLYVEYTIPFDGN